MKTCSRCKRTLPFTQFSKRTSGSTDGCNGRCRECVSETRKRYRKNHRSTVRQNPERFWSKVQRGEPDECWLWLSGLDKHGYGEFWDGRTTKAHRVAFMLAYGEDPGDDLVCHTCDNPRCVNPCHLWRGSVRENNADRDRKGRTRYLRGEEVSSAKLTASMVTEIRERARNGESYTSIARTMPVQSQQVRRVVTGERWAWLSDSDEAHR